MRIMFGFENFTRRAHCAFAANAYCACVAKFTRAFAVNAHDVRLCELRYKFAMRMRNEYALRLTKLAHARRTLFPTGSFDALPQHVTP